MEQILGKNCNQIFSGAPYRVQKDQGHLITSVFGIRGTVPGTNHQGHFGSCSPTQIRAMAVRHRTLGAMARMKAYVPNFPKHMRERSQSRKLWVLDLSEVS